MLGAFGWPGTDRSGEAVGESWGEVDPTFMARVIAKMMVKGLINGIFWGNLFSDQPGSRQHLHLKTSQVCSNPASLKGSAEVGIYLAASWLETWSVCQGVEKCQRTTVQTTPKYKTEIVEPPARHGKHGKPPISLQPTGMTFEITFPNGASVVIFPCTDQHGFEMWIPISAVNHHH